MQGMPETMPPADDADQGRPGGAGPEQSGSHHGAPHPGGTGPGGAGADASAGGAGEGDPRAHSSAGAHHIPGSPLLAEVRSLRRARDGRVVAGVCAGIGQRLNIDPVVLRVLVVALAIFGGPGLLLYGAGWLLLPEEGEELSILERQLGRRRDGSPDRVVFIAGLIVLGVVLLTLPWWGPPWNVPILLFLTILGLLYLLRRNAQPGPDAQPGGTPSAGLFADAPTQPLRSPTWPFAPGSSAGPDQASPDQTSPDQTSTVREEAERTHATSAGPGSETSAAGDVTARLETAAESKDTAGTRSDERAAIDLNPTLPLSPTGSWRDLPPAPPSFWDQPDPLGLEDEPAPEPSTQPVRRPRRPWLFVGTMSATLALIGFLGFLELVGGATIPAAGYVAAALAVVGAGLIVGAWIGRSLALVAVGVLLSLALVPLTVASHWSASTVNVVLRPTTVEQIQPRYDYGAGHLVLDLRDVAFDEDTVARTTISLGAGEVVVLVPADLDVRFSGDVGVGRILPFAPEGLRRGRPDHEVSGFGASVMRLDTGYDGVGGGTLELTIDVGMGNVELRRD